jgi:hypothetical protein
VGLSTIQGKLPFLPGDVWGVVLDQLRTVYLPSSEISIGALPHNRDSQEIKDKVAAYKKEASLLLTNSPEQGGSLLEGPHPVSLLLSKLRK